LEAQYSLWAFYHSALRQRAQFLVSGSFLWFGLFAAPYGLVLVLRSITIPQWKGQIELDMVIFGKLIGFAATVPALLLFQEFYGRG
jgi:hypothetical protein